MVSKPASTVSSTYSAERGPTTSKRPVVSLRTAYWELLWGVVSTAATLGRTAFVGSKIEPEKLANVDCAAATVSVSANNAAAVPRRAFHVTGVRLRRVF